MLLICESELESLLLFIDDNVFSSLIKLGVEG